MAAARAHAALPVPLSADGFRHRCVWNQAAIHQDCHPLVKEVTGDTHHFTTACVIFTIHEELLQAVAGSKVAGGAGLEAETERTVPKIYIPVHPLH